MKHNDLVRTAMTIDDELDDIKRAKIWSRLEDRLAEPETPPARWPLMAGVAAIAAVAAVAALALFGSGSSAPDHDASARADNARADNARVLAVPADTTVTSKLGPHTRASLVGPAELELLGTPGDATAVRLRRGTLLADFTGGPDRSLRIEAPGAVIEIVGTLFAVEAHDGGSCTSVAHGRVRVTTSARTVYVGAGERYCTTGTVEPQPIEGAVKSALEQHGAVITAQVVPAPAQVVPAPTQVVPAQFVPSARATTNAPVDVARKPVVVAPPKPVVVAPREPVAPRASVVASAVAPPAVAPPAAAPQPTPAPAPLPSTPPPVPSTPPPLPITANDLYRAAETALGAGDLALASRALDRLVTEFPSSALLDQAHYEAARIAYKQRSWAVARRHLERLATMPRTPLAEPGHYLSCRIAVETRERGAAACLVDYRTAFPRSPHDLDALALIVQLGHASGGCAGVATEIAELARRHPSSKHAAAWRARCPEQP